MSAFMGETDVEDALPQNETLAEHDKKKHPDGFDPKTDTCKFREKIATETETDKADEVSSYRGGQANPSNTDTKPKAGGISHIFTGSAANYDKPSLLKVGTGEGSQVFGWGLYGSSVRDVAEGYAKTGAESAARHKYTTSINGQEFGSTDTSEEGLAAQAFSAKGDRDAAIKLLEKRIAEVDTGERPTNYGNKLKSAIEILKDPTNEFVRNKSENKKATIYEQTFFTDRAPGDESHLLMWEEQIGLKKLKEITEALPFEKQKIFRSWVRDSLPYGNKPQHAWGKDVYEALSLTLEGPKSASEFLRDELGYDGVKYPVGAFGSLHKQDGDKVGWNYVSFRDDNIRIDKKYVDGQKMFDYQELMAKHHSTIDPMEALSYLSKLDTPEEMAAEFARIMESGKIEKDKPVQDELVEALVMDADTLKDQTLQEHDRIHHKGGYHEGDTCKFRDKIKEETPEDKADEADVWPSRNSHINEEPPIVENLKREIAKVRDSYTNSDGKKNHDWLKAPNGAETNLSESLWVFVRTPSFKKWFGDWENNPKTASKMVDENGEPMVVYHCSDNPDIKEFIVPWEGPIEWDGLPGLFFSPKPQTAYGKNVYSVFLNIRRPTDMDGKGDSRTVNGRSLGKIEEFGKQYEDSIKANEKEFKFDDDGSLKITDKGLSSLKSDGYYATLEDDGTKEYAVLSPQQVMMLPKNVDGKEDGAASGKGDKTEETVDNKPLVTPEEDAAYMDVVKRGDKETAAKMVRDVASRKGFTEEVWHYGEFGRRDNDDSNYEPKLPFHVGTRQAALDRLYNRADSGAYEWAGYKIKNQNGKWYWQFKSEFYPTEAEAEKDMSSGGPYDSKEEAEDAIAKDFGGTLSKLYLNPLGMEVSEEDDPDSTAPIVKYRNAQEDKGTYSYKIYESGRIKSADPVTYDNNGNVIPLSRRFDNGDDIRGDVSGKTEYIKKMKSLHPDINPDELISRLKELGSREEMDAEINKILGN